VRSYSVAEAKDHFQEMLDHVRAGETIVVTEDGKPLAEVAPAPVKTSNAKSSLDQELEHIHQLFKGVTLEDMMSARHEGHKY
jgi:prevent-host-death family protein